MLPEVSRFLAVLARVAGRGSLLLLALRRHRPAGIAASLAAD